MAEAFPVCVLTNRLSNNELNHSSLADSSLDWPTKTLRLFLLRPLRVEAGGSEKLSPAVSTGSIPELAALRLDLLEVLDTVSALAKEVVITGVFCCEVSIG
jgi:hypothetical protein